MASTIKIKNSSTTGAVPTASDLVQGELAVNVADLGLYTENASGTVVKLNAPSIDDKNTGATKHVTISTGGNIGVGVTPSAWASVWKAAQVGSTGFIAGRTNAERFYAGSNAYYNGTNWIYTTTGYATYYASNLGQHEWYKAGSGTAGDAITFTQAMTLDASGNLGIGVTSPTARLDVVGASGVGIYQRINNTTAGAEVGLQFADADTLKWTMYKTSGNALGWYNHAGSATAMTLDSSGRLLVGTNSSVANNYLTQVIGGLGGIWVQATGAGDAGYVSKNSAGTVLYHFAGLNSSGTVVVGIQANGNIVNTNNSYGAISDVKLKENITDSTPKLAQLNQVRVVNYNLIGDENKQLGVIAQELEHIFPSMVEESPDYEVVTTTAEDGTETIERVATGTTTKSVKYSVFVPMLIKAIQEQQALITSQSELITSLTARIEALEQA